MPRLIIDYPASMEPEEACAYVGTVVKEGKVSESANIPHYCWVTVFSHSRNNKVVVEARRKKPYQKSDSFRLTKE